MSLKKSLFFHLSTLGRFWQEKINAQVLRWNIFFVFLQLGLLVIKFNSLPPQVPLYFSLPWGDQRLTSVSSLLFPSYYSPLRFSFPAFWLFFLSFFPFFPLSLFFK
jgi:hypothetical protein